MEDEGEDRNPTKNIMKQNSKKLGKLLEKAQKKYECLLQTSLYSSKKAYLKGKIEIYRRMYQDMDVRKISTQLDFKNYLMGQTFADIPKRELIHKSLKEKAKGSLFVKGSDDYSNPEAQKGALENLGRRSKSQEKSSEDFDIKNYPSKKLH